MNKIILRKYERRGRFIAEMNKRGDIAVLLLVFIALFLAGVSLFSFISHNKIQANFIDARFVEEYYKKEQIFETSILVYANEKIKEYYLENGNFDELSIPDFSLKDYDGNERYIHVEIKGNMVYFNSDFEIFDKILIEENEIIKENLNVRYTKKINLQVDLNKLDFVL